MSFLGGVARWFSDPAHWQGADGIPTRLTEHVGMSAAATLTAAAIALPIGLLMGHAGRGGFLAINLSNIGRAIPSFAILVIALQATGIGAKPAFIALVALAIPPIITNTFVGMRDVEPELRDAARGLGMRAWQVLLKLELPLALPVVMAGVRTSAVNVVATATLAALVAWGGLGRYIVDGFAQFDFPKLFAGALLVILLSAATELGLAGVQRLVTPRGLSDTGRRERNPVLIGTVPDVKPAG